MAEDLKARLLKPRVSEGTVDIAGVGTVRVRGLSRGEVFAIQTVAKTTEEMERKTLALALLDPVMTEAEVREWQQNSPAGEMEPVADKVKELSGIGQGADKSGVPAVRDGS
jgi:hypothetical protein